MFPSFSRGARGDPRLVKYALRECLTRGISNDWGSLSVGRSFPACCCFIQLKGLMEKDRQPRLSRWAVLAKELRSVSLNAQKYCPPYTQDLLISGLPQTLDALDRAVLSSVITLLKGLFATTIDLGLPAAFWTGICKKYEQDLPLRQLKVWHELESGNHLNTRSSNFLQGTVDWPGFERLRIVSRLHL